MPPGVRQVWASHTPSRLAAPCSRNGFVILRTGGSPSVALHPALRQRSYFRFRVGGAYPEGTCTPLTLRLGGALGVIPGITEFLGEYASDRAMGEDGYLADKGLIPAPASEREATAADVKALKVLSADVL